MKKSECRQLFLSMLVVAVLWPVLARANSSESRPHSATVMIDLASLTDSERVNVIESLKVSGTIFETIGAESPFEVRFLEAGGSERFVRTANAPSAIRAREPLTLQVSAQQASAFVERLLQTSAAPALGKYIYVGPATDLVLLTKKLKTKCIPSSPPVEISDALRASLGVLKNAAGGKYYIIDFFASQNPVVREHGHKVLEVARQTLTRYAASALVADVVPVEADFFANKEAGSRIISTYIDTFRSDSIRKTLTAARDRLKKQKPSDFYVSLLYLQAVYHQLLSRSDTAIISTSIYSQLLDGFSLLPEKFYEKKADVIMLTAASDEPMAVEDTYVEPIRAFWERRQEYGLAIIGAINSKGRLGMTSRDGDGITTVGPASGWAVAAGSFDPETDCGTSFATPFVASEILLAKAYWEPKGFKPNAREVITRLMLSADISPYGIGYYAASGIPALEKLLFIEGTYARTLDGQMQKIRCVDCSMTVKLSDGATLRSYPLKVGPAGFRGLQLVTDPVAAKVRMLIFREELMRWEEVEVASLSLNFVAANGDVTTFDLGNFSQHYKELFTL